MGNNREKGVEQEVRGWTRRGFIGMSAAALAGASLGMIGCSAEEKGGASQAAASPGAEEWAGEADVVVMGFGGAGACAALEAARQGSSVKVYEKAPQEYAGGNSTVCEGAGFLVSDDTEGAFETLRFFLSSSVSDDEIYGHIEAEQGLVEWLNDAAGLGIEPVEIPTPYVFGNVDVSRGYGGGEFVSAPTFHMAVSNAVKKEPGVEVAYESPVVGLVFDPETKEVHGVRVQNADGTVSNIKANKAVIMACGSFEYNRKMLEDCVMDPLPEIYPMGTPYNTGDGIPLAQEVGAYIRHTSGVEFGAHCVRPASEEFGTAIAMANSMEDMNNLIAVNKFGKRFMNETAYTQLSPEHPHPAHEKGSVPALEYDGINFEYPNLPYWFVFDETRRAAGAIASWTNEKSAGSWSGKYDVYTWSDDNLSEIDKGWIVQADTIEELAEKIGVDAETLAETIAEYNSACAAQDGDAFGRSKSLTPVEQGPFYAVEMTMAFINTQGGPARDGKFRVLNHDDEVIPRLYAVGEFGSMWSSLYHGGQNVPEAMCAYAAGADAASLDGWG